MGEVNGRLHELIVPYRRHTLIECDRIIHVACNITPTTKPTANKSTIHDTHREWIDACINELTKPLTKWEEDFIGSVSDQLTLRGWLSDKQAEILERIYTEKV